MTSLHNTRHAATHAILGRVFLALVFVVACALFLSPAKAHAADPSCAANVVIAPGDSLAAIAARYLGDQNAYDRIVAATNSAAARDVLYSTIGNPNLIKAGQTVCVPQGATLDDGGSAPAAVPAATTATTAPVRTPVPTVRAAVPTVRAAVQPAATPTPLSTSVFSPSAELTATEEYDPDVLLIDYLRTYTTTGSPITFIETLADGSNYDRYLTSYESEGNTIHAYMTVPHGTQPASGWPIVVFNHGYIPPAVYRSTERYIAYTDGFARNGYIVFRPDYRGHGLSEGEASGAYSGPEYTIDVLNALDSIKQYPAADPERVGMWGHSMGGYITLRAMVARDDIDAGVIWAGVVGSYPDMLNNWRRSGSTTFTPPPTVSTQARRWRQALIEEMGTPEENPEYWASISANAYLADLSGPVQLHHGTADTDVPYEFSQTLEDQIIAAEGIVEYFEYPGDNHNISGYFNTAMAESIDFFDRYVKNAQ